MHYEVTFVMVHNIEFDYRPINRYQLVSAVTTNLYSLYMAVLCIQYYKNQSFYTSDTFMIYTILVILFIT